MFLTEIFLGFNPLMDLSLPTFRLAHAIFPPVSYFPSGFSSISLAPLKEDLGRRKQSEGRHGQHCLLAAYTPQPPGHDRGHG